MHSKSDNTKIMDGFKTDDIIDKLFESFLKTYQERLEKKMRGSEFVRESVNLLYYHLHRISMKKSGSYIDSPDWIKHKTATINPKNKDNEYFKYALTAALNNKKIRYNPERISDLKPHTDQYNWGKIEFPSCSKEWKKLGQNNKTIAFNILYVPYNTKKIEQTYIPIYNHGRDNQVILLMITDDGVNWHYLAVKSLSRLLRGIISNHDGDFYCLNCFHS